MSKGKKRLVPVRRFKEFENSAAWEQRRLGEVANFYSGGTPSVGVSDYYGGTIPFIRSAEINSSSTELYLSELGLQNSSAKMVNRGDILYALYGATSGEVGISKINGAINQAILAILPYKGYNSDFLAQWLRKNKEVIIRTYLQGGQGNLSGTIVKQIKISFPNFNEQKEIGKLFQKFDALIALHQRKLDKLKRIKSAYLTEMFPAEGEREPKRRFSGYTGAWEQRRLGEVANFYSGGTPSVGVSDYYGGTIPFIRSAEINSSSTELYLSELGLQNSSAKMVNRGDILYALYGATSGEVGISKINGAINQAILAILPYKGYNSDFLAQWLRKNKEVIIRTYLQGGQGNLSGTIVKQIKISFPNFNEQKEIGKLFQKFDALIALHQRKLDKLKKLKAAYLNEMFV